MYTTIALLIIIIDIFLLYKNKENHYLVLFNFILLYFNYSICAGVYIFEVVKLNTDLTTYENGILYHKGLMLLFVFSLIRLVLFKNIIKFKVPIKNSSKILFNVTVGIILYIGVFEINRIRGDVYQVNVSPLYEYSYVFFMFGIFFSKQNKKEIILLILLAFFIISQDFYYGGRATSLQIMLVFVLQLFFNYITIRNIIIPFFIINFLFSTVALYRDRNFSSYTFIDITNLLADRFFVNDTAVYAYHASITHLFLYDKVDINFIFDSFISFVVLVFLGGGGSEILNYDATKADLTRYATLYQWNEGGGMFFSYFYFWFGILCFFIFIIILYLIRKKFSFESPYSFFCLLVIIVALPRWYLYSPIALLRSVLFILPITFLFYSLLSSILAKRKLKIF